MDKDWELIRGRIGRMEGWQVGTWESLLSMELAKFVLNAYMEYNRKTLQKHS